MHVYLYYAGSMKHKPQPTLPGLNGNTLQVTIKFGTQSSTLIRKARDAAAALVPTIRITETDIVRGLLTDALRNHAATTGTTLAKDFNTYK